MAGLAVLVFIVGYVVISAIVVVWVWSRRSWRAGVLALAAAVALPSVDAALGRQAFDHYCKTEGKVVIAATVSDVDGIGVTGGVFPDSPAYYGYRFVEGGYGHDLKEAPWMLQRVEVADSGETIMVKSDGLKGIEPKARYVLREGPLRQSFYFNSSRVSVKELSSGRELAGFDRVGFRGGWAEQFVFAFADSGPSNRLNCPEKFEDLKRKTHDMLHATLAPR